MIFYLTFWPDKLLSIFITSSLQLLLLLFQEICQKNYYCFFDSKPNRFSNFNDIKRLYKYLFCVRTFITFLQSVTSNDGLNTLILIRKWLLFMDQLLDWKLYYWYASLLNTTVIQFYQFFISAFIVSSFFTEVRKIYFSCSTETFLSYDLMFALRFLEISLMKQFKALSLLVLLIFVSFDCFVLVYFFEVLFSYFANAAKALKLWK